MQLAAGALSDFVVTREALCRMFCHPARDFAALLAVISN